MCDPISAIAGIGLALNVAGTVSQGISAERASRVPVEEIERQKTTEAYLNATEEQRTRQQFQSRIAQQRADLIARGVTLDSPTAVYLGETAAREMTFEAQSIRQGGVATRQELTAQQRVVRAQGRNALIRGGASAAGTVLNAAPDLWPDLLS